MTDENRPDEAHPGATDPGATGRISERSRDPLHAEGEEAVAGPKSGPGRSFFREDLLSAVARLKMLQGLASGLEDDEAASGKLNREFIDIFQKTRHRLLEDEAARQECLALIAGSDSPETVVSLMNLILCSDMSFDGAGWGGWDFGPEFLASCLDVAVNSADAWRRRLVLDGLIINDKDYPTVRDRLLQGAHAEGDPACLSMLLGFLREEDRQSFLDRGDVRSMLVRCLTLDREDLVSEFHDKDPDSEAMHLLIQSNPGKGVEEITDFLARTQGTPVFDRVLGHFAWTVRNQAATPWDSRIEPLIEAHLGSLSEASPRETTLMQLLNMFHGRARREAITGILRRHAEREADPKLSASLQAVLRAIDEGETDRGYLQQVWVKEKRGGGEGE